MEEGVESLATIEVSAEMVLSQGRKVFLNRAHCVDAPGTSVEHPNVEEDVEEAHLIVTPSGLEPPGLVDDDFDIDLWFASVEEQVRQWLVGTSDEREEEE